MIKFDYKKLVIVLIFICIITTFIGCGKTPDNKEKTNNNDLDPNYINMLNAVGKVGLSISNSKNLVNNTDLFNLKLEGALKVNDKLYNFDFNANLDPQGSEDYNKDNKVFLEIKQEDNLYIGVYYIDEILYLKLPVEVGTSYSYYCIKDLKVSDIIKSLNEDKKSDKENKTDLTSQFMDIMKNSLSNPKSNPNGKIEELTFDVNLGKAINQLIDIFNDQYDQFHLKDLLNLAGLDQEAMVKNIEELDNAKLKVIIDSKAFSKCSIDAGDVKLFEISNFKISKDPKASDVNIDIETAMYKEYNPTNMDIKGKFKIDITEGFDNFEFANLDVLTNFEKTNIEYDYIFKSSLNILQPSKDEFYFEVNIPDKDGNDRFVKFHYLAKNNNTLYADLTAFNIGKMALNGNDIMNIFKSVTESKGDEKVSYLDMTDLNDLFKIAGFLAPKTKISDAKLTIDFDQTLFNDFFKLLGFILPFKIKDSNLTITKENYNITNVDVNVNIGGGSMKFLSSDVKIGAKPIFKSIDDVDSYTIMDEIPYFTVNMDGNMDLQVGEKSVKEFLEAATNCFIEKPKVNDDKNENEFKLNIDYDLDKNIKFKGAATFFVVKSNATEEEKKLYGGNSGICSDFRIDFFDNSDNFIMEVWYQRDKASPDEGKFYILTETFENGKKITHKKEYNLKTDVSELMKVIYGENNVPKSTSDEQDKVTIKSEKDATLSAFLDYDAVYKFLSYIRKHLFNSEVTLTKDLRFEQVSISVGPEVSTSIIFDEKKNKRVDIIANNLSLTYKPLSVKGFVGDNKDILVDCLFSDNCMPSEVEIEFNDGSTRWFKVDKWEYDTSLLNSTNTIKAKFNILGVDLYKTIRFKNIETKSILSVSNVDISKFVFNINDKQDKPLEILEKYNEIPCSLLDKNLKLHWVLDKNLPNMDEGKATIYIKAYVENFLGEKIYLPTENGFKATLFGNSIKYEKITIDKDKEKIELKYIKELNKTFFSYGGMDPRDEKNYSNCAKLTSDGNISTDAIAEGEDAVKVDLLWDLSNVINYYNSDKFNPFATKEVYVKVNIPTTLKHDRIFDVKVIINGVELHDEDKISFSNSVLYNGQLIDNDTTFTEANSSGIKWDETNQKFVINQLKIRNYKEAILPKTMIITFKLNNEDKVVVFNGIKWQWKEREDFDNNYGLFENDLSFVIGDDIGGYQSRFVKVETLETLITDFDILNENSEDIANYINDNNTGNEISLETKNTDVICYVYTINNPYNFQYPRYISLSYQTENVNSPFNVKIDTDFINQADNTKINYNNLYNGGNYVAEMNFGSQILRIVLDVKKVKINNVNSLIFNEPYYDNYVFSFDPYTDIDFTNPDAYPKKAISALGVDKDYVSITLNNVPVEWDLSEIKNLYVNGNPNLYKGIVVKVIAKVKSQYCGEQLVDVDVKIKQSIIEKAYRAEDNLTNQFDFDIYKVNEGKLIFSDPLNIDDYPKNLWVKYTSKEEFLSVPVEKWDISTITDYYKKHNSINGEFKIYALIGNNRGGFQNKEFTVNVTSDAVNLIKFSKIPLLANGTQAVTIENNNKFIFNPYATDIKNIISYPEEINFKFVNDESETVLKQKIVWDLSSLQKDEIIPYKGGEFTVYAKIVNSENIEIKIPIKVVVEKKIIDKLNDQGLFNVFIDPIADVPLGSKINDNPIIKEKVKVSFLNSNETMKMNLTYDRSDLVLNFNGKSYLRKALAGNDFGGYQPIGLNGEINLVVLSRYIEKVNAFIDKFDGSIEEKLVFNKYFEDGTSYQKIDKDTYYFLNAPNKLNIKFSGVDNFMEVPLRTENSVGLCFEWVKGEALSFEVTDETGVVSVIEGVAVDIKILNIIPSYDKTNTKFINNPIAILKAYQQENIKDKYFIKPAEGEKYEIVCTNTIIDPLTDGKLNLESKINKVISGHNVGENIIYSYFKDGVKIDKSEIMNAGIYTIRVDIFENNYLAGYDECNFEIAKINSSASFSISVNNKLIEKEGPNNFVYNCLDNIYYNGKIVPIVVEGNSDFVVKYYKIVNGEEQYMMTIDDFTTGPIDAGIYRAKMVSTSQNYLYENVINYEIKPAVNPYGHIIHKFNDPKYGDNITCDISIYGNPINSEMIHYKVYRDASYTEEVEDVTKLPKGKYYVKISTDLEKVVNGENVKYNYYLDDYTAQNTLNVDVDYAEFKNNMVIVTVNDLYKNKTHNISFTFVDSLMQENYTADIEYFTKDGVKIDNINNQAVGELYTAKIVLTYDKYYQSTYEKDFYLYE